MNRRVAAIAAWATVVLAAALYWGGGSVAPCLGYADALKACVASRVASHPAPPAILDTSLPWQWLGLFVVGLVAIVTVTRRRPIR